MDVFGPMSAWWAVLRYGAQMRCVLLKKKKKRICSFDREESAHRVKSKTRPVQIPNWMTTHLWNTQTIGTSSIPLRFTNRGRPISRPRTISSTTTAVWIYFILLFKTRFDSWNWCSHFSTRMQGSLWTETVKQGPSLCRHSRRYAFERYACCATHCLTESALILNRNLICLSAEARAVSCRGSVSCRFVFSPVPERKQ